MIGQLDNTNPHGIRVAADRAPVREDVKAAFAKGSRKATAGIDSLTKPPRRNGTAATALPPRQSALSSSPAGFAVQALNAKSA